jgi:glycosyltransferase involved in cell wall biosynthesis
MTVYYLSPDATKPSGGIRTAYAHVDALNRNGIDAAVAHEYSGFRCTWFANDTRVVGWSSSRRRAPAALHEWRRGRMHGRDPARQYVQLNRPPELELETGDVLVVPAIYGPLLHTIAPGIPKVVLNQGAGHPPPLRSLDVPYEHSEIVAVLAVAEEGRELLSWLAPAARLHVVPVAVDLELFAYRPEKRPRIAYMPRRNGEHAQAAVEMLARRGTLGEYKLVPIDGLSHEQTAEIVASSLIFLAVSLSEGFGLPPAEAMATGSIVVGYDAVGGREFMRPDVCFPVVTGDVLALAQTLERVLTLAAADPDALAAHGRAAHELIASRYSPERQERELLAFWRELLQPT